jgi:hypothetical protein
MRKDRQTWHIFADLAVNPPETEWERNYVGYFKLYWAYTQAYNRSTFFAIFYNLCLDLIIQVKFVSAYLITDLTLHRPSWSCPTTRHEGARGERRYSFYSFSTSALDGGEWSTSRPCRAFAPGKWRAVPIVQETAWAPKPVWTQRLEEKSFRLCRGSNLDRPVVQPIASHYTDWDTRLYIA